MVIFQNLSTLAIKQVINGACGAFGLFAGAQISEAVGGFLSQRFLENSARLSEALQRANDNAWRALEIALAGHSWWDRVKVGLASTDEKAFRQQVQGFLDVTPLANLPSHGAEFRALAVRELREARKRGLLLGGQLQLQTLGQQAGHLAGFRDPHELLQAEQQLLHGVVDELRKAGFPNLAQLLSLMPGGEDSLLVLAARYFFRREIENDRELFQGLAFAQLERMNQAQEAGFSALAETLSTNGQKLEGMLDNVQDILVQTHLAVQGLHQHVTQQGLHLQQVGQTVAQVLEQQVIAQRLAAGETKPTKTEQNLRLDILNTLLKTPHRELDALAPLHAEVIVKDPLFYSHLAAWYAEHGEVRDHKEMFVITLTLSAFEGHRDIGLALLRGLPPYQVGRIVDFIHGVKRTRLVTEVDPTKPVPRRKSKKSLEKTEKPNTRVRREIIGESGLKRNVPRSLKTEVARYLAEREADPEWFDSTVLVARKSLKRLYALLHIKPGSRAQAILFEDNPPADSRLAGLKRLANASNPDEQARAIMEAKIPFRIALSVLTEITPRTLEALIDRMSPQEVINSMGLLKRRGALDQPDLKALVDLKLELARKDKRVSALKAEEAIKAVSVDAETRKKLEDVADTQIKARGRITRSTALLVDKSGSMETAIDVGKRLAAMISAICESELHVYAFDKMAYPIVSKGKDLASWHKAFQGITATGMTSCGVALESLRRKKVVVEQIIMVTDEEEYDPPFFVESLLKYRRELGADPAICIVKVPDSSSKLEDQCKRAGIAVTTFDFHGDYYSLPNLIPLLEPASELDLLMEIMEFPLPERRTS